MLVLAFVYIFLRNAKLAKILQAAAILLAIAGFYFHIKAQAHGEYHKIGQAVGEYVVHAMQSFGKTGIGRLFLNCILYAQHHEWVINVIIVVILVIVYLLSQGYKGRRNK